MAPPRPAACTCRAATALVSPCAYSAPPRESGSNVTSRLAMPGSRPSEVDRRASARRVPAPEETLSRIRLRTGRELAVVDIGDTGALVEGTARLLPGTHVEVHVVTRDGRTLVRSRITRAAVFAVAADS